MSDDAIAPDLIVRTALGLLPVPEHRPRFWSELDALLAAEPVRHVDEPALAVGPTVTAPDGPVAGRAVALAAAGSVVSPAADERPPELTPDAALGLLPPALRRRSTVVLLAVALAAIVLVVVSGAALVRHRASAGLGTTDVADVPRGVGAATISSPHDSGVAATSDATGGGLSGAHTLEMSVSVVILEPRSRLH